MLVQKRNVQLEIKPSELEKYKANGYKEVKVKANLEEDILNPKEDVLNTNSLDSELEDKKEDLEEDILNPKSTKSKK